MSPAKNLALSRIRGQQARQIREHALVTGKGRVYSNERERFIVTNRKQRSQESQAYQVTLNFQKVGTGRGEVYKHATAEIIVYPGEEVYIAGIKLHRRYRTPSGEPTEEAKGRGLFPIALERAKKEAEKRKIGRIAITAENEGLKKYYEQFGFAFTDGLKGVLAAK